MDKRKLKKGERLIGAHILKEEADFYKISQMSGVISFRIHKSAMIGNYVSLCLESGETGLKWLEMFIMEKIQCLSVIPDEQYLMESMKSSNECIFRHSEWYGIDRKEMTKNEDDTLLKEVQMDYVIDKSVDLLKK